MLRKKVITAGRSPECPVAVVERGWLPTQRTTVGTLADIADRAEAAQVENPAVVVVGDVVRVAPAWAAAAVVPAAVAGAA